MSRSDDEGNESPGPGGSTAAPARPGWCRIGPGVLLVAIAVLALVAGRNLPGPSGAMLGPGRVPLILSVLLLVLGAIVAIEGFFHRGAGARGPIVPAILVAAAGAVFLLTVGLLGLAVATGLAAALVAGYGLRTRPVACVLVVVACVAAAVLLDMSKLFSSGGA